MPENKIDIAVKERFEQMFNGKLSIRHDKNGSWDRLQKKRKNRRVKSRLFLAAAVILGIGLFFSGLVNLNNNDANTLKEEYTQYERRQKLKEIEARMSGNYYSTKLCLACDDIYYQVIKQDRPVKYRYFSKTLN